MRRTIMFHNDQLPLNDMLLMCRLLRGVAKRRFGRQPFSESLTIRTL